MPATATNTRTLAIAALLAGATCIGTSALWVKVSEAGPVSTAFWRVFLALPFLWAWAWWAGRSAATQPTASPRGLLFAAGFFFAGDLAVWHWSIVLTSVANATLLANLAPIFVTLAAWLIYRRVPTALFVGGLATALTGVVMLIGGDFSHSGTAMLGDALGVVTAMFYAAYQLTVTKLRGTVNTARIMAVTSVVTAAILLPLAWFSSETFFPSTSSGWGKVFGLALISQVAGQSLIAYAMAHLPATVSSVGLLLQPVMAGLFAWLLLGETLGAIAIAGAVLVLIGIRIATTAELKNPFKNN
ncbi:MAG: DMT family transporter [Burkholderiales bacterium]